MWFEYRRGRVTRFDDVIFAVKRIVYSDFVVTLVNNVALALTTSLNDEPLKGLTLPEMAEVIVAEDSRPLLFEWVAAPGTSISLS